MRERTAALAASEARFRSFTSLGSDWYWEQDAAVPLHRDQRQLRRRDGLRRARSISGLACGSCRASRRRKAAGRCTARGSNRTRRSSTSCCGARIRARLRLCGDQRRARVRRGRSLHRLSRHRPRDHASRSCRGEHQPARPLRHADEPLQPRGILRAVEPCAVARATPRSRARRAVHRPRPLQGRQRCVRPCERRRSAEDHGAAARRYDPRLRHRGAPRRRRIHRARRRRHARGGRERVRAAAF